jgi:hypothetical protein
VSVAAMVVVDVTIVEPGLVAPTGIVSEVVRVAVVMVSLRIAAHVTVIDVKALRIGVVPW